MDVAASIRTSNRFSSLSWGSLGVESACPYGVVAGGLQDGVVSLWSPHAAVSSGGQDQGLISSTQVHQGAVNCLEFNPLKSSILASCGVDSQVKIINLENPAKPEMFAPSTEPSKHAGSEVLCCAWNRKVQHILCSCSNAGSTIVWDLKMKKEVINFKDPSGRMRCSSVAWHPDVPTQLIVAYDDDRHPSIQMWDLRNCQYPFKESAGHTKGILDVSWCPYDSNLLLSSGKDNKVMCWCLSNGSLDTFCDISSQQGNFEARWAPKKPGIFAAASMSGSVNVHSVLTQQTPDTKYCPKWVGRQGGMSFGFGAKLLVSGTKDVTATEGQPAPTPSSWCHSLVVPDEPELVPTADLFERWVADRKLKEFCDEKTSRCGGSAEHEGLMWDLMGLKFEGEAGRQRVPTLLGFDGNAISNEAEGFLGKKPGSTLMAPPEDAPPQVAGPTAPSAPSVVQEALDPFQAEDFFNDLAQSEEKRKQEELAAEEKKKQMEEMGKKMEMNGPGGSVVMDWSNGPEALIKKSLLVGDLPAAVECCFKSGRWAEGLLLASGGGVHLWTRARDEYLRLQGDSFLSAVGNIMTNDFEKLVGASNLSNWKETLAILATYAGDQYQPLCLQLAERLEKEKFDIRSAVICYICAGDFSKTVTIWSNTHVASQGSKHLALQDLVEKMAVLQEATKFSQADPLYNAKLTQYAEILANSGRLTAAMRFLCLLRDDNSSAMLRERIYNAAPMQMNQLLGRPPAFPFEPVDIRVSHVPQQAPVSQGANPYAKHGAAPGGMSAPGAPGMPRPNMGGVGAGGMGHAGMSPGGMAPGGMCGGPAVHGGMNPGGMGHPGMAAQPPAPGARPGYPGAAPAPVQQPPAPAMNPNQGLPPRPNVGMPTPGAFGGPGQQHPGMQPSQPQPTPHTQHYSSQAPPQPYQTSMPTAGPGVLPPSGYTGGGIGGGMSPASAPSPAGPPRQAPAPQVPAGPIGEPMQPNDLGKVRNILTMLLDAQTDARKRDDISKRLEDLYSKLQAGSVKTTVSQKVMQLVNAVEAQDFATANRTQQELCSVDWEQNKNWLMGLKRLMAR
eukprot:TRINITY_DN26635_c0_g1_i1.p1 TRINITY_DN26635_c0_g1~~TRINITY_DN26635_c0_g1_i1.p1  ORF type:complete len:1161 (+),score=204.92 TRINITY_DN26635_c0_g1_i1:294-3485(+)